MGSGENKYSQRTIHGKWMNPEGRPGLASIIIPTFNRAAMLDEALASAAGQTYRPLEIIVVDDGSTDETQAVVDRWRDQFANDSNATLRYVHQTNAGVGAARNRGLIESQGEFIQYLDSDDALHLDKLSLQISCLQSHPQCGYIFSDWVFLESPPKWKPVAQNGATELDSSELYCSVRIALVMVGLYRRQTCYLAGPFVEDMQSGEDKEFNLRVLLSTQRSLYLPGKLCASRDHPGPRLTDAFRLGQNHLVLAANLYQRMTDSAAAKGRLDNPRLVQALVKGWSTIIAGSFYAGRSDLTREAIQACKSMPIGIGRHTALSIYELFAMLPTRISRGVWRTLSKVRRVLS
jgi:glycosyltransferase involved in cell wall biosynthesis